MSERLIPREVGKTAEGLLQNPPRLILVFDNWRIDYLSAFLNRKPKPESEEVAYETMQQRAAVAALLYHSELYTDENRPIICSFAGEHMKGDKPGSQKVAEILRTLAIPASKIVTRETTINTVGDITQLHSLAKELHIDGPIAVVTTDDHVARAEQEMVNHFNSHNPDSPRNQVPKFYVISRSLILHQVPYVTRPHSGLPYQSDLEFRFQYPFVASHGLAEKVAYQVTKRKALRPLKRILEWPTHRHTPAKLARIEAWKRVFVMPKSRRP